MNVMVLPTLAVALILFIFGEWLWRHTYINVIKSLAIVLAFFLSIPGILFSVYYLHLFDGMAWFYELRSLPLSELTASGAGLFVGVIASIFHDRKFTSKPFLLALLALGIVGPYLKPIVAPIPADQFQERWVEDVCLQSTPSSCGAASAATLFRAFDVNISESEVAQKCFTYRGGTENWYLARLFAYSGGGRTPIPI